MKREETRAQTWFPGDFEDFLVLVQKKLESAGSAIQMKLGDQEIGRIWSVPRLRNSLDTGT